MRIIPWALALSLAAAASSSFHPVRAAEGPKNDRIVKNGSVVSLQYTLSGQDGKTIESNKGQKPLTYTHGSKQVIPGLEKGMAGMKVGEERHITVKPEDGYGPVNPNAYREFPKEKVPPNMLKVGTRLLMKGHGGPPIPVRIKEIKEKTVVIDMNHPMAGKTLVFDVKVLDIGEGAPSRPAKPAQTTAPNPHQ